MNRSLDLAATPLEAWAVASAEQRHAALQDAIQQASSTTRTHGTFITVAQDVGVPPDGELCGVPIAVKDNIDVAGMPTTAGSPLLRDYLPEVDASVVAALKEAGSVVVGKTNMHELAFGITSNNADFGPVRNPVDTSRVAGGSSGGSAAAVALGVVPVSLGTDTGGSVTIPAAFCGVVGFRPTTGRYPGDGVVNLSWTRDSIGIHGRTVQDVRAVDRVIVRDADAAGPPLDRLVLGVPRSRYDDLDEDVALACRQALDSLAASGVHLVDVQVPDDLETGNGPGLGMVLFEAERTLRWRASALEGGERFRTFADIVGQVSSPDVRRLVAMIVGQPFTPESYEQARRSRLVLRRSYADMFRTTGVRALVAPSVPVPAPPIGADDVIDVNGAELPTFPTITRNTAPGTVAGVPMLTLPLGRLPGELPVALTFEGAFGSDVGLLATGERLEQLLHERG